MDINWNVLHEDEFDKLRDSVAEPRKKVHRLEHGERRDAAVLFLDLKGFTSLSAQLDTEQLVEIINNTFVVFTKIIKKYLGYVDKYEGDAIMAVFGGKKATEKDTENAIRAGLEMFEMLGKINQLLAKDNRSLQMRIGVNFGEVVVTKVGYAESVDETIYGDAVNLAARLEPIAPPGSILVTSETREIVEHVFKFSHHDTVTLKGVPGEVDTWCVEGVSTQQERWTRHSRAMDIRFVGREQELQSALRWIDSDDAVAVLEVSGPAGMGKSRFADELSQRVEGVAFYKGSAASFFPPSLFIIVDLLKNILGLDDLNPKSAFEASLRRLIPQDDLCDDLRPILGYLLKYNYDDDRLKLLVGKELFHAVKTELKRFFEYLLSRGPVVFVLDDLHWLDAMSRELLEFIIGNVQAGSKARFMLLAREYYSFDLHCDCAKTHLELKPFDDSDALQLLAQIYEKSVLDTNDFSNLLRFASGNPFYLEEIAFHFDESALVGEGQIETPSSLKSLILSRIDHISSELKDTLKASSVLGFEFLREYLAHASESIEDWDSQLVQANLDMIVELRYLIQKQGNVYRFSDLITHETLYKTVLNSNKRILHELAANAIIELHSDATDYYSDRVANHFYHAGKTAQAIEWFYRSVRAHFEKYDLQKVMYGVDKLLELDAAHTALLKLKQAEVLNLLGRWKDAAEIAASLSLNEPLTAFFANRIAVDAYNNLGQKDNALAHIAALRSLIDRHPDDIPISQAFNAIGSTFINYQMFDDAREALQKAADARENSHCWRDGLDDATNALFAVHIGSSALHLAKVLNNLGVVHESTREFEQAKERYLQALELCGDDKLEQSKLHGNLANLYLKTEQYELAEAEYLRQYMAVKEMQFKEGIAKASTNLGVCYMQLGDDARGGEYLEQALAAARMSGDILGVSFALLNLAEIARFAGETDKAIELSLEGLPVAIKAHDSEGVVMFHMMLGDLFKAREDTAQAKEHYLLAIEKTTETGDDYNLSYISLAYGELLQSLGRVEESRVHLAQAKALAEKAGRSDVLELANQLLA